MKKTTKFLFLIMTFLTFITNAKALMGNIVIEEKLTDLTLIEEKANIEMYYLYSENDNKFLYTFSPYNEYISGEYTSTYDYPVSKEILDQMNYIAYFGYGYQDHNDISWYITTQYLIWNTFVDGSDTLEFTNEEESNIYKEQADIILEEIARLSVVPSFAGPFNPISDEKEITNIVKPHQDMVLTDENNVLSKFKIINSNGFNYEINNNELILNFNYATVALITLVRESENLDNSIIYENDNIYAFTRGNINFPSSYIWVKALYPTVTINLKKDAFYYPSLEGTKYGLYFKVNDDLIGIYSANSEEQIIIDDVLYDTYYLKEIVSPLGYKENEDEIAIDVRNKDTFEDLELEINKEAYLKTINFIKYLEDNNQNIIPDSNSAFTIYTKDEEPIYSFKTDDDGAYSLTLPYGKYIIREDTPINNYTNEDIILIVNSYTDEEFTFTSKELLGTLNLTFKDNSDTLINGITSFKVQRINAKSRRIDEYGEDLYEIDNGTITLNDLPYGDYVISDISIPDSYKIETEEVDFSISENNDNIDLTIYSELKTGSIIIKEIDKDTGMPISDATFRIYNSLNELLWEEKTNSEGIIEITNVPVGNYYIKKVLSIENNILSDEEIALEVKEDTASTITISNRSVVDVPITGTKRNNSIIMFFSFLLCGGSIIYYDYKKV